MRDEQPFLPTRHDAQAVSCAATVHVEAVHSETSGNATCKGIHGQVKIYDSVLALFLY